MSRIGEASYGNTYEAAVAAPPANGRGALLGKSKLLRVRTGDPSTLPPTQPGSLLAAGLEPIVLVAIPVPTLSMVNWSAVEGSAAVTGTGDIVTAYDRGSGTQTHRIYRARLLR